MPENAVDVADLLASSPPELAPEQAEEIVRDRYGIQARAERLTSERDVNFLVEARDGRRYVLKVANAAEPADVTDLQTEALLHIARVAPSLPVPRVVPTRSGATGFRVEDDGAGLVRLITFLPGRPMNAIASSSALRTAVARTLAELGRALSGFRHPAAERDLLWDIRHAARFRPLIASVDDDGLRMLAASVLDRFDGVAGPALGSARRQVVHNDFNPHNLLVDPGDPDRIAGVIDFGDIVKTPLVCDVAVAASYQLPGDADPVEAMARFAAAYHAVRPLTATEARLVPDLVAVRMVATVAITAWRAARYPENRDYILRNVPRARAGLERLAVVDPDEAARRVAAACGLE